MAILNKSYFHDEEAAFARLEAMLWPDGPVCPHCGAMGRIYELKGVRSKRTKKNPEGVIRHGLRKCGDCGKQFTVRVGTIFEDSHAPLHKWFQAIHLMCASKKGISAHQLHRMLEVQYKTAWFMAHRIREAMRRGPLAAPFGGSQAHVVEADETFIGRKADVRKQRGHSHKHAALTLIDRTTGEARSFHIDEANAANIVPIVRANVAKETKIATDEAAYYSQLNRDYYHGAVNHGADEWLVEEFHTNSAANYFSIFKRGMKGVYQHCSEKHLHRYLAEFDFRYSNRVGLGVDDQERATKAIAGAKGKRLTYRTAGRSQSAAREEFEAPF